jgi:uncharacterized protein YdhG (YjbR/CyaY superfamily)
MPTKPQTIDEYLAGIGTAQSAALQRLRRIVHAVVPKAQECISYGIPAFRLDGKMLIYLGAAAKHCAIYGVEETRTGEFKDYDTSGRGTLRFTPDRPLPEDLVRRLLQARIAKVTTATRKKATVR